MKLLRTFFIFFFLAVFFLAGGCSLPFYGPVDFIVTADMREYTLDYGEQYFRGAVRAAADLGGGEFMVSPGDIDPPDKVYAVIREYLGPDYLWYPVVGNHEAETDSDMAWLREFNAGGTLLPNIVNTGPSGSEETTFSFDAGSCHFAVVNQYFDGSSDIGTDGDVPDALYTWLKRDLETTDKPIIFVFGHEPAFPKADAESGRERHMDDSLNQHPENRDRFWALLKQYSAVYFCGHTHNYSAVQIDGVWQIDAGHARGIQDPGAKSTFLRVTVSRKGEAVLNTYRLNDAFDGYELYEQVTLF